jgi:hypothetical protein
MNGDVTFSFVVLGRAYVLEGGGELGPLRFHVRHSPRSRWRVVVVLPGGLVGILHILDYYDDDDGTKSAWVACNSSQCQF